MLTPGRTAADILSAPVAMTVQQFCRAYTVVEYGRDEALRKYRALLDGGTPDFRERFLCELRGKHLMCWCRLDQPCHADILLEVANA